MEEPESTARPAGTAGRRRRDPQATYAALIDALLSLLAEGRGVPAGRMIAERAGTSERTVFVHFADREALYEAAARRQAERWKACAEAVPPAWPTRRKVEALTHQRERMYELMTPIRQVGLALESESPGLRRVMGEGDEWFRTDLAAIFAPELTPGAARPGGLLDALDAAASWACWNHLRTRTGLAPADARRAVTQTLSALLS